LPAFDAPPTNIVPGNTAVAPIPELTSRDHARVAIRQILLAAGLAKTAACLEKEADLPAINGSKVLRGAALHDAIRRAMEQRSATKVKEHKGQQEEAGRIQDQITSQKLRVSQMHEQVKGLRNLLTVNTRSLEERTSQARQHHNIEEELAARRAETIELRRQLAAVNDVEAELNAKVAEAELELVSVRSGQGIAQVTTSTTSLASVNSEDMFDRFDTDGDGVISREEFEQGVKAMQAEALKIQALLEKFDAPDGVRKAVEASLGGVGKTLRSNDEIRSFVRAVFARLNVAMPPWQEHVWQDLYRSAAIDQSFTLDSEQAAQFAKQCLEATLTTLLRSPAVAKALGNNPLLIADRWRRAHGSVPLGRAVLTYKAGVTVDVLEASATLRSIVAANMPHWNRMARVIEAGDHIKISAQIFYHSDRDGNGRLTWNEGEIGSSSRVYFTNSVCRHRPRTRCTSCTTNSTVI
jgi:hypothetical protein